MSNIDTRFIDYNFPASPKYTRGYLGMGDTGGFRAYQSQLDLIPDSDWESTAKMIEDSRSGLSWMISRIKDQGQEGSCVGNGSTYAFEATYRQQFGVSVPFSAMSLYKQIGRSAQSGAVVTDAIEAMAQVGVLPEDTPNNRALFPMTFPATGFGNKLPVGYESEAKKFRATEWLLINSKAALVSALLSGRPVVVGREGHCICYTDILFRKGKMLARYVNSWGIDWGDAAGSMRGGFGYDSEKLINESSEGAFALMAITVPT